MAAQRALHAETWDGGISLRVRMALHTGTAEHRDSDYFGQPLNRVARLLPIGYGGQVLLSNVVHELVRDSLPPEVRLKAMGEHRLRDLAQAEPIFQLQHADLPSYFPPLKSLQNTELPNNLPQQVTSFVGREKEMADVKRLLESTRLLTLTAIGGAGKSRLSLQVAADALDEYKDGVWLIELAALTDPELVAPAVAQALHVKEEPGKPILQTLTQSLQPRKVLIVLDNCEHVLAACAQLCTTLMRACPSVKILASSREALKVSGETVYTIPPLSLPDPKQPQTPSSLSQYEAVGLFVERAVAARPDFMVTNQNAAALAQLCVRLDGIPLALELAAARVRNLPIEEINTRLDQRFRLLTGGSRTALPRQQTLRALIDWSYDLLNPQEQALLARISVFVRGWTLAAAEKVCADEEIEEWDIFDLLIALSDKSLVVSEEHEGEARYSLLETIREYGRAKLQELAALEPVAERHADYYAALAATHGPRLREQGEDAYAILSWEADNLRAALDWRWKSDNVQGAAEISVNLAAFWTRKGWLTEAYALLLQAANRQDALADDTTRASVLKAVGLAAYWLGDIAAAETFTQQSIEVSRRAGTADLESGGLSNLALIAQAQQKYEDAERLFEEAVAISRTLGDDAGVAGRLMNLGLLHSARGSLSKAQAHFEEARQIYERASDTEQLAACLCNQSDLALRQGKWAEAESLAEQSLVQCRQIEYRIGVATALANLGEAATRQGKLRIADTATAEACGICAQIGFHALLPIILTTRARGQIERNQHEEAAKSLALARRLREALRMPCNSEEEQDLAALEGELGDQVGADLVKPALETLAGVALSALIDQACLPAQGPQPAG